MSEQEDIEAFVDTAAKVLQLVVSEDGRTVMVTHLKIATQMAKLVLEFPLPDEAEPAPVFTA